MLMNFEPFKPSAWFLKLERVIFSAKKDHTIPVNLKGTNIGSEVYHIMSTTRFNINGLELEETQTKVRNQLESMNGVYSTLFSAGQDYVDINYDDEQITPSDLSGHLQKNGYKIEYNV